MGNTSGFTKVIQDLVKEGDRLREKAAKSTAVPLMQEKLSRRDAVSRVGRMTPQDLVGMTPEQRGALLKSVGTDAVLDIIRRGGGG